MNLENIGSVYLAVDEIFLYCGFRKMSVWMWMRQLLQFEFLVSILHRSLRYTVTSWCWYFWSIKGDMMRYLPLAKDFSPTYSWYRNRLFIFIFFPFSLFQAKSCSSASITRLKNINRRTVDALACRLYFYYSYSYELTNSLAEIRRWVCYQNNKIILPRPIHFFSTRWFLIEAWDMIFFFFL